MAIVLLSACARLAAPAAAGQVAARGASVRAAVLESQAFGAYRPDYAAALRAKDNQDPLARGETLHHDPAAAAAAAAALADPGPDSESKPAAAANGGPPPSAAADRGHAGNGARRCAAAVDVQVPPEFLGKKYNNATCRRCQVLHEQPA